MAKGLRSRKRKWCDEKAGSDEGAGGHEAAGSDEAIGKDKASGDDEAAGSNEAASSEMWSTLPDVPLRKIFLFLNRQNQYQMARTCRSWKRGLKFPGVWDIFGHIVKDRLFELDIDERNFADQYGHLFQNMMISCEKIENPRLVRHYFRRFKIFMGILTLKSQLITIYFKDLKQSLNPASNAIYHSVCVAIANFLGGQRQLKSVSFVSCFLKYSYCIQILRKTIQNNKGIVNLILPAFLNYKRTDDSADEQILPEILSLNDLKYLVIDYRLVLGEKSNPSQVFESLENHRKNLKLDIHLFMNANSRGFNRLSSDQWNILKTRNPNMQIEVVIVSDTKHLGQMGFFIVSDIPIKILQFSFNSRQSNFTVTRLLNFLVDRNSTEYLKILLLTIQSNVSNLDLTFMWFLRRCRKLEEFTLFLPYPVNSLEAFLDSLQKRKPESLNKIVFVIEVPDENAKQTLTSLSSQYRPRLALVQIALEIKFE